MLMRMSAAAIAGLLMVALVSGWGDVARASENRVPSGKECPAGESIAVAAPTTAAPTTVTVSVAPPVNLKPAKDAVADSYHLHYFVDIDPGTVVQAGQTVPSGNPKIIHSATTTQDVGALSSGKHTVWVVLGDVSHLTCTPMVVGSVSFDVSGAALPATGTGAKLDRGTSTILAPVLLLLPGLLLAAMGAALHRGRSA